jgi:hypothetical protein
MKRRKMKRRARMRRVEEEIASSSSGTGRIEKESKWYKMT